jgi:hypothetical protein
MKIYRVHYTQNGGESVGYEFFANKKDAQRRMEEYNAEDEDHTSTCDFFNVKPSKKGILALLHYWAGHADNG